MKYSGYIVVAIYLLNGTPSVFKVGWLSAIAPSYLDMRNMVFLVETDTIEFFGFPFEEDDAEECWMRIPSTAYSSVSWKWYSASDIELAQQQRADEERGSR
jgi:hypothetical protein